MSQRRIAILGAGPAGLGAAYRVADSGRAAVTVLERQATAGGLAGSFELAGIQADFGSHRLHPSCDPGVLQDIRRLLGNDLLERPRHGRIRLRDRWIRFPLRPLDLARSLAPAFSLGVAADAARGMLPRPQPAAEHETFGTVLERGLGRTICRDFYFPYAEKLWGLAPDRLSPVQARRRVQAGSLTKLVRKVLGSLPGIRPQGFGHFFYPRNGFGQITDGLHQAAERAGARFEFGANVESIRLRQDDAVLIDYRQGDTSRRMEFDDLWSTIPVTALVNLLQPAAPPEITAACEMIRFRSMILIYLVLDQTRFSEFDAHYFPERQIAITRLSEPKNYAARDDPPGRTVLCAELPCSTADPCWSMSEDELGNLVAGDLHRSGIGLQSKIERIVTRRLPQAYPIYARGYEAQFAAIDAWLGSMHRILTFGRQGLFAHDNTHHTLAMAYAAAACLSAQGVLDRERWQQHRQQFESHVVED